MLWELYNIKNVITNKQYYLNSFGLILYVYGTNAEEVSSKIIDIYMQKCCFIKNNLRYIFVVWPGPLVCDTAFVNHCNWHRWHLGYFSVTLLLLLLFLQYIMHFWLSKDCINCVSVLQTLYIVLVDHFWRKFKIKIEWN